MIKRYVLAACGIALCSPVLADDDNQCAIPQATVTAIQNQLKTVVMLKNGGIFGVGGLFPSSQNFMWSAVVDRKGVLCSVIKTTGDPWPGSRAIAIAKAGTANDFSNVKLALSTANLYAATQPGGSLWGLNNSNPFNPDFLGPGSGKGQFAGGIITFGGGVALYQGGQVIGGLGVSGDSSCADHAIAYRMRHNAGFDGIPAGVGHSNTDNISYAPVGTPPTGFQQPHCFPGQDITP
jgi:uncharacterized protein GlcG (DUF336 family)